MFKAGNVNVFYLIMAAWAVLSLQLAYLIASEIWGPESFSALPLVWPLLNSGPILPILWVRKYKTSPVDRWFVLWTVAAGGLGAIVALRYGFIYTSLGLFCWMMLALTSALLLRDAYHKYLPALPKLSMSDQVEPGASDQIEPGETIFIAHEKYLHLLNAQAAVGFPSVTRLRAHFLEALPEVIPSLKDDGGLDSQHQTTREMARMRQFILEKLTCQLAYLCAVSFFDQACGPDFRFTKQYQALVDMLLEVKSTEQKVKGFIKRHGQKLTVITIDDLRQVENVLEQVRNHETKQHGRQVLDSDLSLTWVAYTILVHKKFLPEKPDSDTQTKLFEMMHTGVRDVTQTFDRMSSEYATRR
jgi:hypothetical protein